MRFGFFLRCVRCAAFDLDCTGRVSVRYTRLFTWCSLLDIVCLKTILVFIYTYLFSCFLWGFLFSLFLLIHQRVSSSSSSLHVVISFEFVELKTRFDRVLHIARPRRHKLTFYSEIPSDEYIFMYISICKYVKSLWQKAFRNFVININIFKCAYYEIATVKPVNKK